MIKKYLEISNIKELVMSEKMGVIISLENIKKMSLDYLKLNMQQMIVNQ